MKLLCITDLHGSRSALVRILQREPAADVILLGGDLTNFGTTEQAEAIVLECRRVSKRPVLAVAGNCDSPEIDQRLVTLEVSLFRRGVFEQGVGFYGVSAMPPWRGDMYELTEEEIAAALRAGRAMVAGAPREVVLSHPPPRGTRVDATAAGAHVGSVAVRSFIDDVQPALVVCGHIHEACGIDRVGKTVVVNCGYGGKGYYAVAELAEAVEVELRQA